MKEQWRKEKKKGQKKTLKIAGGQHTGGKESMWNFMDKRKKVFYVP